jgi:hypothetical protein
MGEYLKQILNMVLKDKCYTPDELLQLQGLLETNRA